MHALIDGDILVYRVGFACESDSVEVAIKTMQKNISRIINEADCYDYDVYLTGDTNFRTEVAVQKPYKGNRKSAKPRHYGALRQYLLDMGAFLSDGEEADDMLGRTQGDDTVICTIDKDLDMIPGWHYNFVKGKKYYVTEETGLLFFWYQMMTGDSTDNIVGVPGMGEKRANDVIADNECRLEGIIDDVKDMYNAHYADDWEDVMQENADLLWIRRSNWMRFDICSRKESACS